MATKLTGRPDLLLETDVGHLIYLWCEKKNYFMTIRLSCNSSLKTTVAIAHKHYKREHFVAEKKNRNL